MQIYSGGVIAVFTVFALMYCNAYRKRGELGLDARQTLDARLSIIDNAGIALIGVLSLAIATFGGPLAAAVDRRTDLLSDRAVQVALAHRLGLQAAVRSATQRSAATVSTAGYFARVSRHFASSAPTTRQSRPDRRRRGSARASPSIRTDRRVLELNCGPYSRDSADAISRPTRTGRSRSRSVTIMNTPWHAWPPSLAPARGRERHRIEADARQRARVQRRRQRRTVDPRRADLFERRVGAAADRDVRPFDRADARIDRRRHQVAHVRRRVDPRQPGLVEPVVAAPVLHRHDGQIGADLLLAVEQPRQLADRHAVPDRHRQVADEADRRRRPAPALRLSKPSIGFGRSSTTTAIFALRRFLHARSRSSPGRCRSARRCPAGRRRACRCRRASPSVGRRVSP